MKLFFSVLLLAASTSAYTVNRRDIFRSAGAAAAVVAASNPSLANALEACPKGSKNCIRTTWTPPSGTNKSQAVASLKKAIEAYPQEGQNKVDLGGWAIVEDGFDNGSARIEYTSGIGNFAKYFNGGKPFIDDLKLEIEDSGVVQVRSSSRIGESDFDVNKKRLTFLGEKLAADGWTIPSPSY